MPAPGSHRLRIAVPGERHVWCNLVLGASCSCEVPSVFEVETPIVSELGFWDLRLPWNQFCSDFLVAISCFYDWVKVHCWVWWCCGVCYSRLKKTQVYTGFMTPSTGAFLQACAYCFQCRFPGVLELSTGGIGGSNLVAAICALKFSCGSCIGNFGIRDGGILRHP